MGELLFGVTRLPDPERALFLSLSCFAGLWTLDAAEAICASSSEPGGFENLAALVGKSLVGVVEPEASGSKRYRMLESIRSYARPLAIHGPVTGACLRYSAGVVPSTLRKRVWK